MAKAEQRVGTTVTVVTVARDQREDMMWSRAFP